ncbi:MAG: hypothetical protein L0271_00635 [Gemmatimonadetes bacterium]|nr:hypothetical protein [Gemmatimonadota bacterium]
MIGLLLSTALLGAGLPAPLGAQQNRVGRVDRIASLGAGARPIRIRDATDLVEFARGSATWFPAGPGAALFDADRLRVRRYVDMRLDVERPAHDGRLTFLAEVLNDQGGRVFGLSEIPDQAYYRFVEDTTATGELGVVIESGALVVDWDAGRLRVIAAGHPTLITETRVTFVTDATGQAGFLYVEEGTVTFPATAGFVVQAGQAARLQAGVAPTLVGAAPAQAAGFRSASRYHADRIWSQLTPFWRKPAFLVPAVGVAAGAAVWLATRSGSEGDDGVRVIIRIPF